MSIFSRATKADLEELKDVIDTLSRRIERQQKTQRSVSGVQAGLARRIRKIELLIKSAPEVETEEEGLDISSVEEEEVIDPETRRLRLGRG